MKRIFLIDGNSLVYRAFFATPYLSNSKGVPTNATYAFINMLRKLLNEHKPDAMVVIFDSKVPSFRTEISSEYKATRPPMPGNLQVQFPYVKAFVAGMGMPIVEKEGFEADDVIATMVRQVEGKDLQVSIVTSDKDMMQLVSDRVFIVDTMKNAVLGEKEVEAKFGINPCLIADFLALAGDSSDNIPGAPGIGEKTAQELVAQFGTIEQMYAQVDEIRKPAVKEKIVNNRDRVEMSKRLATLRSDVPLEIDIEALKPAEPDVRGLRKLFRELEFTGFYKELKPEPAVRTAWPRVTATQLAGLPLGVLARISGRCTADVRMGLAAISDGQRVALTTSETELASLAASASELVVHNLKPLIALARKEGRHIEGERFDTMLAAYLVNPLRKDYAIDGMIEEFLDGELPPDGGDEAILERAPYLIDLKGVLVETMRGLGVLELYRNVEMPLVEVLADMECVGVRVDRKILNELSRDYDRWLNTRMKVIHELAGEPFNINSSQQLARILFEKLKLPPLKKTKNSFSTDNEVLVALSEQHPLPAEILEYRTIAKLKSTYIDRLPALANPQTGRIHASFNQMVVATGRLSSSDPNLQNIPIKGTEGRKIREAFIPEDGFMLLSSDYSQIELRVLAHISRDEHLVEAFLNDEDIHSRVAGEVFGVSVNEVTSAMRRTAKVINFGIVYGISGFGLAKQLGVGPKEAQAYIDAYFERHKGISEYIERTIDEVRETGFVRTLFGRVRYIPEINNPDQNVRGFGERTAMNTPIQGTAADIIKMAMVAIHRKLREQKLLSRLILQIHDELVLEVKEEELDDVEAVVRREMEHVCELAVPLKVSVGKGRNWAEAHD